MSPELLFLLAQLCFAFLCGGVGYEIGRHRKYDEVWADGERYGYKAGWADAREGLNDDRVIDFEFGAELDN